MGACRQVLVTQRPEATTALLMQLCTAADAGGDDHWVAQVADFTHLYDERYFCSEQYRKSSWGLRQVCSEANILSAGRRL